LDSSKNSEHLAAAASKRQISRFADGSQFRGYRGGVISMHRALTKFDLQPLDLVLSIVLAVMFSLLWLMALPVVCRIWKYIFTVGTKAIALPIQVGMSPHHLASLIRFTLPYPQMEDANPDAHTWWLTAIVVVILFVCSYLLPKKHIPIAYMLRAVGFVQASALVYFLILPGYFPHTPNSYMEGLAGYGLALTSFVPVLFGLTFYIFDFGLVKKTLLTALTMVHLSLFIPLQVLLQAVLLQKSVLFMPVLYIVFGLPVDVLIIIAFYSWGMSWATKQKKNPYSRG
jgi:hypothetical protein